MRVNDPSTNGLAPEALGGQGVQKSQQTAQSGRGSAARSAMAPGESPDRVALSELSSRVRDLAVETPEQAARLERLHVEVSAGRYHVDALELSRQLLEEALLPRAAGARS